MTDTILQRGLKEVPQHISQSEITETLNTSIAVVGEGFAGLCCALAAKEAGADVTVITASSKPIGRGGSVYAAYSKVMAELGVPRPDTDNFALEEFAANQFLVDQKKWYRLFDKSEQAMDWLIDRLRASGCDVVLEDANFDDVYSPTYQLAGTHAFVDGETKRAGVGITLALKVLENDFLKLGGRVLHSTVAHKLEKTDGRVSAVIAKGECGYIRINASKAVVLATGDFSSNRAMLEKYCPQYAQGFTAKGGDYDVGFSRGGLFPGDGHIMALEAGAAWQKIWPCAAMIQGSRLCTNMPYGSHRGLRLNSRGERFCNEDINGAYTALIAMQESKGPYIVWASNYARDIRWRAHGGQRQSPDTPPEQVIAGWEKQVESGRIVKADTIEGVVEKLGLPHDTAMREIARYNELCRAGKDSDFHKKPKYLQEIREAPFYGGDIGERNFYTVLGGPRTDWHMHICDEHDEPIPGLYALGSMVGDMFAGCYNFRIPGHNYGACLTFGYLTGRVLMGIED